MTTTTTVTVYEPTNTADRVVVYTERATLIGGDAPGHAWYRSDPDESPECLRCCAKAGGAVASWACGHPGPEIAEVYAGDQKVATVRGPGDIRETVYVLYPGIVRPF